VAGADPMSREENDFVSGVDFWEPLRGPGFDLRVAFWLDDHGPRRLASWWWRKRERRWARQRERDRAVSNP